MVCTGCAVGTYTRRGDPWGLGEGGGGESADGNLGAGPTLLRARCSSSAFLLKYLTTGTWGRNFWSRPRSQRQLPNQDKWPPSERFEGSSLLLARAVSAISVVEAHKDEALPRDHLVARVLDVPATSCERARARQSR